MIHQIYLQDRSYLEVPRSDYDWGLSWKKYNPEYEHRLWDDKQIIELMKTTREYNNYLNYYKSLQKWISKLDFAKYMLLYEYGGIYADLDTECVKTVKPIVNELNNNNKIEIILSECDPVLQKWFVNRLYGLKFTTKIVNTGVIVAKKRSSFLKAILDKIIKNNKYIHTDFENVKYIGPIIITKQLETNDKYKVKIIPCDVFELPIQTPKSISIHKHYKSWDADKQLDRIMKDVGYYPIFLLILAVTLGIIAIFINKYLINYQNYQKNYNTFILITCIITIMVYIVTEKLVINYYIKFLSKSATHMIEPDNNRIYNSDSFNFMNDLKVNWMVIREEANNVYKNAPLLDISRSQTQWKVINKDLVDKINMSYGWIKAWSQKSTDPNINWLNYGLYHEATGWCYENIKKCPNTYNLLKELKPRINIAGFSLMKGISRIDPHIDSTGKLTNSLAYHLGLIIPEPEGSCTLVVDNYIVEQKEGQVIIFDSNFTHYAVNNSTQDRIILYIDFKT